MVNKFKNKALFIADIALIMDEFVYDDYMISVMTDFIMENYYQYTDLFNLVFEINEDDNAIDIDLFSNYEEYGEVIYCASHLDDSVSFSKLLNEVGDKNSFKISKLAMLFCSFLKRYNEMMENSFVKIRQ